MISNPIFPSTDTTGVPFVQNVIPAAIGLILVAGAIIFVFMLLISGVQWISSGGDKQALEAARGRFTNALIGLVIMLSVFAIILLIERFFNVTIMTLDIAPLVIQ